MTGSCSCESRHTPSRIAASSATASIAGCVARRLATTNRRESIWTCSSSAFGSSILSARRRVRVEELGLYPAAGRAPVTRFGFAGLDLVEE
ncbi:hypothetical protein D3C86_2053650 [compost metagenome]